MNRVIRITGSGGGGSTVVHFRTQCSPAVYNANFRRIVQVGVVAITYELIHDTRVIPMHSSPQGSTYRRLFGCTWADADVVAREGATLVVETACTLKPAHAAEPSDLRLVECFRRVSKDLIEYQAPTFVDPRTWTTSWTAALDLKGRPDDAGVFEYACDEGPFYEGTRGRRRVTRSSDRPRRRVPNGDDPPA